MIAPDEKVDIQVLRRPIHESNRKCSRRDFKNNRGRVGRLILMFEMMTHV